MSARLYSDIDTRVFWMPKGSQLTFDDGDPETTTKAGWYFYLGSTGHYIGPYKTEKKAIRKLEQVNAQEDVQEGREAPKSKVGLV